jgi:phosphatidylinositol 3-kinase
MLTDSGKLFHLDFGFILGRQPKWKDIMVPEIRIAYEMVLGMGGIDSEHYRSFK